MRDLSRNALPTIETISERANGLGRGRKQNPQIAHGWLEVAAVVEGRVERHRV